MRTDIDTNIISAIWSGEASTKSVLSGLDRARSEGRLIISAVTYGELFAHPGASEELIKRFLDDAEIEVDFNLDEAIWVESGRRFALYAARRRRSYGSNPRRILPDFLIGTHALLRAERLMTLDVAMYRTNFPELKLLEV